MILLITLTDTCCQYDLRVHVCFINMQFLKKDMHKKFICSSIDVVIFMKVIYGELLIILKLFYLILLYLSIVGNPWSVLLKLIDHIH